MKSIVLCVSLLASQLSFADRISASEMQDRLVSTGIAASGAAGFYTFGLGGALPAISSVVYLSVVRSWHGDSFLYEGLGNESIEVLSSGVSIEDLPSLSMFKQDLLGNPEALEESFKEQGIDVRIEDLSDEDIAYIGFIVDSMEQ